MAKQNYGYEKRQKELKRQRKQEEKRQRKLDRRVVPASEGAAQSETAAGVVIELEGTHDSTTKPTS